MPMAIHINIKKPSVVTIPKVLSEISAVLSNSLLNVVAIVTALVYADDILCKEMIKFNVELYLILTIAFEFLS